MAIPTRLRSTLRLMPLPALVAFALYMAWSSPSAQPDAANAADPAASSLGPAGAPASQPLSNSSRAPRAAAVGCLISPKRVTDIGTPVTGVVAQMHVERGDAVRKGQALVLLESHVEQASLGAARARAAIEADVQAADATLALARQRQERSAQLARDGFVSPLVAEQTRTEYEVAQQKLAQARGAKQVQQHELRVVGAQLGQRTLKSPFDGVVVERWVNTAERVEEKPLLRIAQLDPLRVELVLPAARWGSLAKGSPVSIVPELPGAGAVVARITHVDPMLDAASNTFRVRLDLPNPGHKLPAGARCKAELPTLDNHPAAASRTRPSVQGSVPKAGAVGAAAPVDRKTI